MHILCVFIYTSEGENPQKGAYLLHIPNSMIAYIIVWSMEINYYEMSPSYFISNSEILKKYMIIYLYNEPLYLAHLRSLFGPYSLFNLLNFMHSI